MNFPDQPSSPGGDQFSSFRQTVTVYSPTITAIATVTPQSSMASISSQQGGAAGAQSSGVSSANENQGGNQSNNGTDRTTIIILAVVLSCVGLAVIAATIWCCRRCSRRRRLGPFRRGITPIADDEIETWKGHRTFEKNLEVDDACVLTPDRALHSHPTNLTNGPQHHQKHESTSSLRKPPSVIVYTRRSEDHVTIGSPRSPYHAGKLSFDGKPSLDMPFTPIQARAPNAREGLTDETVPGDVPYYSAPKRRASRLSKHHHARNKSSRSSSSLHISSNSNNYYNGNPSGNKNDGAFGYESEGGVYYGRGSHEELYRAASSELPPRLSLSEDWPAGREIDGSDNGKGLAPRPWPRAEDIGRAIG